jgi:hypothetical protein
MLLALCCAVGERVQPWSSATGGYGGDNGSVGGQWPMISKCVIPVAIAF